MIDEKIQSKINLPKKISFCETINKPTVFEKQRNSYDNQVIADKFQNKDLDLTPIKRKIELSVENSGQIISPASTFRLTKGTILESKF